MQKYIRNSIARQRRKLVGVRSERSISGLSTSRVRSSVVLIADMGLEGGLRDTGIGRAVMSVVRVLALEDKKLLDSDGSVQISKTSGLG